jgi:inner membrane transporter RhtA
MTTRPWSEAYPVAAPVVVVLLAMLSFQTGAAIAKTLFPVVGAAGAAALRMGLACAMLLIYWRPWRLRPDARALRAIVLYGVSLGSMNLLFYSALQRLPLGIAVALEFTGPLAVAIGGSRRALDFLWAALACAGLLALLPRGPGQVAIDPVGILFALAAGACWAIYILVGKRVGSQSGGPSTALGMLVGACLVVPVGVAADGSHWVSAAIVPAAVAVAFLSSALPYSLEMYALTRLPTRTFGILMSLDPALAALAGLAFLGERLSGLQWLAVFAVMLASGGSAATARAEPQAVPAEV